jgi:hypothetical protein
LLLLSVAGLAQVTNTRPLAPTVTAILGAMPLEVETLTQDLMDRQKAESVVLAANSAQSALPSRR